MHQKMSQSTKDEVMNKLRGRYARAGQQHKRKLIDQAIDQGVWLAVNERRQAGGKTKG
jgi:hypothetical protein